MLQKPWTELKMPLKLITHWVSSTQWGVSKYGFFSGLYFPVFGLDTENYRVNLSIHKEYERKRTRKNSLSGQISQSVLLSNSRLFCNKWFLKKKAMEKGNKNLFKEKILLSQPWQFSVTFWKKQDVIHCILNYVTKSVRDKFS